MFTGSDLSFMKSVQEAHMMDRCLIRRKDEGVTVPVESICGLQMIDHTRQGSNQFSQGGHYETVEADAKLRLPGNVQIDPKDIVEVTHRFGSEITPHERFEVVGIPLTGPSGQRVFLKAKRR